MIRSEKTRRHLIAVLRVAAVAAVYYGSARLGLLREVTVHGAVVTPLWPPTGVALGALLCLGVRVWPGIAIGSLVVVTVLSGTVRPATAVTVAASTLAPLCAYLMLRRAGFRVELDRLRDGIVLVFLGGMLPMVISATAGAGMLVADEKIPSADFWSVWAAWWAGDAMGVLMVTPMVLVLRRARPPRLSDRWVEAGALSVVAVVAAVVATQSTLSMIYLVFPILIWAALRFQLAGTAPCALLVSVLAVLAGTARNGPFQEHTMVEVMISLTVLNGAVSLTALLLAAVVTEQDNVRRRIESACEELAEVVDQLAPGRSATAWPSRAQDERRAR
ncbi:MASE1 domain-containing protein [Streptomyces sp. NBC_00525]|uniref:MASE1 domain-containing protein n=1 Tax=Streptomyces sp. NBC_00525 TaxID=2903660 RepID=UPI002E7FF643|nr:MASE1 domain-containing protein [Streptomyces sp. NBC_00525]WUC92388.1 MASE1 domain-containing protein [Streptomyces sp. NBC_00525]